MEQGEWFSRCYLPHRDREAITQHVSVHLADSISRSAIEKIDLSIKHLPESRRKLERRKKLEALIDAGHGSCVLHEPEIPAMIQETLIHFYRERYNLYAWAVMSSHFHTLFQPINGWTMTKIVAPWNKFNGEKDQGVPEGGGTGTIKVKPRKLVIIDHFAGKLQKS